MEIQATLRMHIPNFKSPKALLIVPRVNFLLLVTEGFHLPTSFIA